MNKEVIAKGFIGLYMVAFLACIVVIAHSLAVMASPPKDIALPDNVTALETSDRTMEDGSMDKGNDGRCLWLVKAPDGTPDYIERACS